MNGFGEVWFVERRLFGVLNPSERSREVEVEDLQDEKVGERYLSVQ